MSDFIPLSVPCIKGNEWKYIKECLKTEWVSSAGRYVDKFEEEIAKYTGTKFAVACMNGTSALHVSLLIAGVQSEDEVIVPTLTFIAPVNVVRYCNANPVFMDSDDYYNIDFEKTIDFIEKKTLFRDGYTYNKATKRRVSAIIPIHIFGNAVYLDDLHDLCKERNIKIIEDATESLGTAYKKGKFSGMHSGSIGDLGCLSFNGNKIITTGAGGMILTNLEEYAKRARYYTTQAKDDDVRYIHNEIGYNYRLSNVQAAVGVAQVESLPKFLRKKKRNYFRYKGKIEQIPGLHLAEVPDYANNNFWMYALKINKEVYGKDPEELMMHLAENKIQTRPIWYLNHLQKRYKNCQQYKIEVAMDLWKSTLNIPCSVSLTEEQIYKVISVLKR